MEQKHGKACSMLVCDGSTKGTVKAENLGGFGGAFGVNPQKLPPKPKPRKVLKRSSGSYPEGGNWLLVAESRGWWLLVDTESTGGQWSKVKLVSKVVRAGGANFWLLWNGCRLAANTEHQRLEEHYPEIEDWVVEKLDCCNVG
jgi:hypothetical protein